MKRGRALVMAAGFLVAIALVASFELGFLPLNPAQTTSTVCGTCGQREIVVDVIMPVLGAAGNTTNPSRSINMTLGTARAFEVDVYPTASLNFSLGFRAVLVSSGAAGSTTTAVGEPSATFQPETLDVGPNQKGVTLMTVLVPASAARGTYDAVVSATDESNSSRVWGLYFQLLVA